MHLRAILRLAPRNRPINPSDRTTVFPAYQKFLYFVGSTCILVLSKSNGLVIRVANPPAITPTILAAIQKTCTFINFNAYLISSLFPCQPDRKCWRVKMQIYLDSVCIVHISKRRFLHTVHPSTLLRHTQHKILIHLENF